MLKTGKPHSEGQIFHRRLLSEYITDFTLDNYVSYFELKGILKQIEVLRLEGDRKIRDQLPVVSAAVQSSSPSQDVTPVAREHQWPFPPAPGGTSAPSLPASPGKRRIPRHGSVSVFVDPCSPTLANISAVELRDELIAADPSLATIFQRREELQDAFFDSLHASYKKVKAFLMSLEKDIVVDMVRLHRMAARDLLEPQHADVIPKIYLKLESVLKYRELNLLAFRKILRKFLERCACDSLELQARAAEIDNVISKSNVSQPSLDLREIALELMAVYGTVFKLTYEETLTQLQHYVARSGRLSPRILAMNETFFSTNQKQFPPHQDRPGSFAIRVLAGSRTLLMEKMITEVLQCPRYPGGTCGKFANGEVSVNLHGKLRGDDVFLVQSMVALESANFSNSDAVMELMLMLHSAQLAAASRITAVIPYLAYTRNVASIAAVAEMIQTMGCHHVITVDMHSDQVEGMFSIPVESISAKYEFVKFLTSELRAQGNELTNLTIVAPNGNFLGRAKDFADAMMRYGHLDSERQFVSVCTAVKRLNTRLERQAAGRHPCACGTGGTTLQHVFSSPDLDGGVPGYNRESSAVVVTHAAAGGGGVTAVHTPTMSDRGRASPPAVGGAAGGFLTGGTDSRANESAGAPLGGSRAERLPNSPAGRLSTTPGYAGAGAGGGSPTSPSVFDTHFPELDVAATARMATPGAEELPSLAELEARSSSTLGIEKALRKQEEGRRAVVTHQVEDPVTDNEDYVLVGDVNGRLCVILDTVIDEALSICQVARSLHAKGAERIFLVATHAVLSGRYRDRLLEAPIELIIVTDSVNQDEVMRDPQLAKRMRVVSIAPLLARAIEKIHSENTLSTMFEK